jgi:putative aminopeptidase FrvX
MLLPEIDEAYLLKFLVELLNVPSPTGYAHRAIETTQTALQAFPELQLHLNRKGALIATWEGKDNNIARALTAHADTLGAMVKEIKPNGRLKLTKVGGLMLNAVETEGCNIFTRGGEVIRGSLLIEKASAHVYGKDATDTPRNENTMEVRLDARTLTADDTHRLGINVGDFVAFDPRVEFTNGFVRSRFLDDKACVACILSAVKTLHDAGLKPAQKTFLHISNYEEVGHGAATGIPEEVSELVAVDMAAVGQGQASDEFHATICVKDGGGPYHYGLSEHLRRLADQHKIPYKVDIYPFYHSDGEAFWQAGGDVALALIGPGVDASHNYERTHLEALIGTTRWLVAYLLS